MTNHLDNSTAQEFEFLLFFALLALLCRQLLLKDKIKNRGAQEIVECEVFSCKDLAPPTQIPPTHPDPTRQVHLGAKGD